MTRSIRHSGGSSARWRPLSHRALVARPPRAQSIRAVLTGRDRRHDHRRSRTSSATSQAPTHWWRASSLRAAKSTPSLPHRPTSSGSPSADLIVGNGLGLDDWVIDLAADAGASALIVKLGEALPAVAYVDGEASGDQGVNPHLWLDVSFAQRLCGPHRRCAGLGSPGGCQRRPMIGRPPTSERLAALDSELRARFAPCRADGRRVVSFHDAFPYFARAYGLEVVGVVVDAPGQDPSASEVAR